MTREELLNIFTNYSLNISLSSGVYFMGERMGYFDYIDNPYGEDYHFVPNKDDPDNVNGYSLFNKEKSLREFFLTAKLYGSNKLKSKNELKN